MHFETEDELFASLPKNNNIDIDNGNIKTDIMLISLLVKMLDIIEASESSHYDSLKNICEEEIKKRKSSLQNKIPKTTATEEKEKSKLSPEDKKFVVDTLMGFISGKNKNVNTWGNNSFLESYKNAAFDRWGFFDDECEDTNN